MSTDLKAHALAYALAGLQVLPLRPGGKQPICAHGKDDATTDLETVDRWWAVTPTANVGVRPAADVVVLDVDPRNRGAIGLVKLKGANRLPITRTAHTGGGGLHIWYSTSVPWRRGQLCPGVDLKFDTGYVVAPPSVHPSGRRYEWVNDAPIADAPAWLVALLAPPPPPPRRVHKPAQDGGAGLVRTVSSAQPGNRNSALYWAARRAAADGRLNALRADLEAAALAAGETPAKITATIASAARAVTP